MPELPEVETICRSLRPRLVGRSIASVRVIRPFIANRTPDEFTREVAGRTIEDMSRHGKYLLLRLGPACGSPPADLIFHLMMAGRLIHRPPGGGPPPEVVARHIHLAFVLDDRSELAWADLRHFGRVHLVVGDARDEAPRGLRNLGPEPLAGNFTPAMLAARLLSRRAPVKQVLLDQRVVAGIGNIYADESLHRAGIHPCRRACSLTSGEVVALHAAIEQTLAEAIACRGTSVRSYVDGAGLPGGFQDCLRVYGRAGQACLRPGCKALVERLRMGGRSTHFCPMCQPRGTDVRNSRPDRL
ncbi:MAG TPA: bifunctional DNA-formamidopyrimidine glycosylase/DNA-(apurinic or apyrimidinic site) lyase [Bacillota bacterium]|nr:bifunctional DNA-formamidopyrimidine glycosylase/DNA-(apurinic or apyrimidinic site) lyase [Bacillota bacterium]